MRLFLLLSILIFWGCAKTPKEEVDEAIDVALSYLSSLECQKAIDLLEETGRQNDNPVYLEVLASAYACRAGFDAIDFITSDVGNISTVGSDFMKSLAAMSVSTETTVDSADYQDYRTALNILLDTHNAAIEPSHANRVTVFGARKAGDMDMQILLMSLAQLGKFLHFYGNVNNLGVKGAGTQGNTCFLNYTYASAQAVISAATTGACVTTNAGHTNLAFGANLANAKRRMCEALVLVTNTIDTLNGLTFSTNSNMANLNTVKTNINTLKTSILAGRPELSALLNTTSQSACVAKLENATEFNNMQFIFALLFEAGLK